MALNVRVIPVIALAGAALCWTPLPASAQLSRVGGSINAIIPGGIMRGTDTAYDPVHGVYLIVVGNGPVFGVFVNVQGVPVTAPFTILSSPGVWAHFPRATYSPDVLGGQGGFLVTWHHNLDAKAAIHCVFGRVVSYAVPGALAGGIQQISDGSQGGTWHETGPAMAYSRTSRRFFIAWRTVQYGIQGRLLDVNGAPIGGVLPLENPSGAREPSTAWNPATNEFGLINTAFTPTGDFAAFRRVRAVDGAISARTTFGFAPQALTTAIDVNSRHQYVVAWTLHPGTMSATFDQNGTLLATNLVSSRVGFEQSLGMSFNAATGTFLVVSNDVSSLEIGAVELRSNGAPITTPLTISDGAKIGTFYPMTRPRTQSNQWDVVFSRDFQGATNQIVQTATRDDVAPVCGGPDPFVSLGGGRCINGRWLPPTGAPRADFDGDLHADLAIYRPSTGTWYLLGSLGGFTAGAGYAWGESTDVPLVGDFDGDVKPDITVYRPSGGQWFVLKSSTNYKTWDSYQWGTLGDVPVPSDYDGDGKTDIAVYRPSTGVWYLRFSSTGFSTSTAYSWGVPGDLPVPGDYDGDGKADLAVYRPSSGHWFILKSRTDYAAWDTYQWGSTGDMQVPGDYDGDGTTDIAIYRPSTGGWYMLLSSSGFKAGAGYTWGAIGDVPVPDDYDGDGRTDLAVYRVSTANWFILTSSSRYMTWRTYQWGSSGDVPILKRP